MHVVCVSVLLSSVQFLLINLVMNVCACVHLGLAEKFSAGDAGHLVMPDADIVRQLTSVNYTLDGASAALNRVSSEHLDLSSDQAQSQWFALCLSVS